MDPSKEIVTQHCPSDPANKESMKKKSRKPPNSREGVGSDELDTKIMNKE